ncbi:hypothetical protein POPTR_002G102300v4 [Populus trichocarpa]|uniref:Uncharacterized protein n=1 Tax=Populus trichocarpa TaxID=3694 RepID=A0ACC0TD31_POPTR|nr:uncharacterized protein LOC7461806 [Populus trichocarpa]KAI5597884.1 hypothetical protein BDE02_02G095100 [Populus trichocarpa]KAI9399494.1 hypothetical protein POPTR_002G102300v4 [Populus trichocarpa]
MDVEKTTKTFTKKKSSCHSNKIITCVFLLLLIPILVHLQASPFYFFSSPTATSRAFFNKWKGIALDASAGPSIPKNSDGLISKLRESVTFLPLKDLRFAETAMEGNTWFMSSLNDTHEANEAEYLYFPSQMSKGRLLCIKGRHATDGTKNSYALVWPEALPDSATLMKGLTFVSDTFYDYGNLWHGLTGMAPFVGWSMKNKCLNPTRWVLFHWGELRSKMGSWLQHLMQANFGDVKIEGFGGDGPYCFEKAVVMRHNEGSMGKERKLQVFDLLRCNARRFCGISPEGKGQETNERGEPIIRLTLLMRTGSRSFKNASAVTDIFARECAKVEGCTFKVAQSENLSFCDQVRVMTYTDVVASPHGAQLTNMLFMDRNSSVMEFFPKGWLELAGVGQYAHHWMADQSGMNHRGAWWDPLDKKECPFPQQDLDCFNFYKNGKVGHNETHFAEWARIVLDQVRISKMQIATRSPTNKPQPNSIACKC